MYDLTDKGVRLFFVVGFRGLAENRQFSNAVTQGCEGYSFQREKLLKTDLKQLQELYRPP